MLAKLSVSLKKELMKYHLDRLILKFILLGGSRSFILNVEGSQVNTEDMGDVYFGGFGVSVRVVLRW